LGTEFPGWLSLAALCLFERAVVSEWSPQLIEVEMRVAIDMPLGRTICGAFVLPREARPSIFAAPNP